MGQLKIFIPREKLAAFCNRHHIRKLAFFGSVLSDNFSADSDVDVLVEFTPGHIPGLAFFAIEAELSEILGRQVDLHTPGFLSHYFREKVMQEAEIAYDSVDMDIVWEIINQDLPFLIIELEKIILLE